MDLVAGEFRGACVLAVGFSYGDSLSLAFTNYGFFELGYCGENSEGELSVWGVCVQRRVVHELKCDAFCLECLDQAQEVCCRACQSVRGLDANDVAIPNIIEHVLELWPSCA